MENFTSMIPGLSMVQKMQKKQNPEKFADEATATAAASTGGTIGFILAVLAAVIAWQCNKGESMGMRVFYTFVAYIFGFLYLIYYFLMKRSSCPPNTIMPFSYFMKKSSPKGFSYGF
jgi:hypothetical protein